MLWVCFGDFAGRYFSLSLGNLSLGHGRRRFESPSTGAELADKLCLKLVPESINGTRMIFSLKILERNTWKLMKHDGKRQAPDEIEKRTSYEIIMQLG